MSLIADLPMVSKSCSKTRKIMQLSERRNVKVILLMVTASMVIVATLSTRVVLHNRSCSGANSIGVIFCNSIHNCYW
jgi:hypothetical protein